MLKISAKTCKASSLFPEHETNGLMDFQKLVKVRADVLKKMLMRSNEVPIC